MIKNLVRLLPIAAAAVLAVPAMAGTVTLSNITGEWSDAHPTNLGSLVYGGAGTGAPTVRWGIPSSTGGSKSGYNFTAVSGPIANMLPPSPTSNFSLGTFEHLNFPISSGTSITGIKLKITTNVQIDSVNFGAKNFFFDFDHWETPNGANPCANGQPNGSGVNKDGCADRVMVNYNTASDTFDVDGAVYTLNVFGFQTGGGNPFTQWWTAEGKQNTADLMANISLLKDVGPPTEQVPEPSTFALAGLAVLGLAASRRRKTH